jgi:hypothetical protein
MNIGEVIISLFGFNYQYWKKILLWSSLLDVSVVYRERLNIAFNILMITEIENQRVQ